MTDSILDMKHISKAYAGVPALRDVSFTCVRGQVHALVGENGAGKSTLIKILGGAVQADSGEIVFKGRTFAHLTPRLSLDMGISIIYQELALSPYLTVAENIFLGREPNRGGVIQVRQLRAQAAELLERLHVHIDLETPVSELTVAKQQMVEIAKALSRNADLIVMDEPSAILVGEELEQLFRTIKSLQAQGVTIVYISHRLDEVFQVADTITVLKDGAVVGSQPRAALSHRELVQMMVGRPLEEVYPPAIGQRGAPVLTVENVSNARLKDVSLTLHAGETLGIAGMVGSGRTELARAIFGADPVTRGRILINGQTAAHFNPAQAIKNGVALVPEDRKAQGLFTALPIRQNITLPILKRLSRGGIVQMKQEAQVVNAAQQTLSISMASGDQEAQFLSGGNQQKVVLAKWLETRPSVIIMDEPTRGIDIGAKFEIYQLMRRLNEQGVAILMISSELPEILGMSDRILVMRDGQIVGELARADATEQAIIERATTGASVA
ncbi:sugar ABC transporter ATP-binding protein [Candidatus Flexifilum breve]|uniref:sugar ABC transporter ATP-binding protein n=1 Tax=Candidatus Flexifilum breve TaxID=3140694 RepID=UPI0031CC7D0C